MQQLVARNGICQLYKGHPIILNRPIESSRVKCARFQHSTFTSIIISCIIRDRRILEIDLNHDRLHCRKTPFGLHRDHPLSSPLPGCESLFSLISRCDPFALTHADLVQANMFFQRIRAFFFGTPAAVPAPAPKVDLLLLREVRAMRKEISEMKKQDSRRSRRRKRKLLDPSSRRSPSPSSESETDTEDTGSDTSSDEDAVGNTGDESEAERPDPAIESSLRPVVTWPGIYAMIAVVGYITVELPLLRSLRLFCHRPGRDTFEIVRSVFDGTFYSMFPGIIFHRNKGIFWLGGTPAREALYSSDRSLAASHHLVVALLGWVRNDSPPTRSKLLFAYVGMVSEATGTEVKAQLPRPQIPVFDIPDGHLGDVPQILPCEGGVQAVVNSRGMITRDGMVWE
jgi:hypothetical protein